ncbi:NUDIX domain-containing protein [Candidatus Saccharibacteria bacterium]|nr:NUDIX domain-containing protein [Candidatus Saccharibacteria bacterium]
MALAVFKDGKIMVVRDNKNDEVFYAVGGKVEEGETDVECLKREVKEELDVDLDPQSIKFLHEFNGPPHGKPDAILNMRFYEAKIMGEPHPTEEIVEIQYFDSAVDQKHLSEIARTQIFPWLKAHGYIN